MTLQIFILDLFRTPYGQPPRGCFMFFPVFPHLQMDRIRKQIFTYLHKLHNKFISIFIPFIFQLFPTSSKISSPSDHVVGVGFLRFNQSTKGTIGINHLFMRAEFGALHGPRAIKDSSEVKSWKINMEPQSHPIEKENHLPNHHFQVPC